MWLVDPAGFEQVYSDAVRALLLTSPQALIAFSCALVLAMWRRVSLAAVSLQRISSIITVGRYKYVLALLGAVLVACIVVAALAASEVISPIVGVNFVRGVFGTLAVLFVVVGTVYGVGFFALVSGKKLPRCLRSLVPRTPAEDVANGQGQGHGDGEAAAPGQGTGASRGADGSSAGGGLFASLRRRRIVAAPQDAGDLSRGPEKGTEAEHDGDEPSASSASASSGWAGRIVPLCCPCLSSSVAIQRRSGPRLRSTMTTHRRDMRRRSRGSSSVSGISLHAYPMARGGSVAPVPPLPPPLPLPPSHPPPPFTGPSLSSIPAYTRGIAPTSAAVPPSLPPALPAAEQRVLNPKNVVGSALAPPAPHLHPLALPAPSPTPSPASSATPTDDPTPSVPGTASGQSQSASQLQDHDAEGARPAVATEWRGASSSASSSRGARGLVDAVVLTRFALYSVVLLFVLGAWAVTFGLVMWQREIGPWEWLAYTIVCQVAELAAAWSVLLALWLRRRSSRSLTLKDQLKAKAKAKAKLLDIWDAPVWDDVEAEQDAAAASLPHPHVQQPGGGGGGRQQVQASTSSRQQVDGATSNGAAPSSSGAPIASATGRNPLPHTGPAAVAAPFAHARHPGMSLSPVPQMMLVPLDMVLSSADLTARMVAAQMREYESLQVEHAVAQAEIRAAIDASAQEAVARMAPETGTVPVNDGPLGRLAAREHIVHNPMRGITTASTAAAPLPAPSPALSSGTPSSPRTSPSPIFESTGDEATDIAIREALREDRRGVPGAQAASPRTGAVGTAGHALRRESGSDDGLPASFLQWLINEWPASGAAATQTGQSAASLSSSAAAPGSPSPFAFGVPRPESMVRVPIRPALFDISGIRATPEGEDEDEDEEQLKAAHDALFGVPRHFPSHSSSSFAGSPAPGPGTRPGQRGEIYENLAVRYLVRASRAEMQRKKEIAARKPPGPPEGTSGHGASASASPWLRLRRARQEGQQHQQHQHHHEAHGHRGAASSHAHHRDGDEHADGLWHGDDDADGLGFGGESGDGEYRGDGEEQQDEEEEMHMSVNTALASPRRGPGYAPGAWAADPPSPPSHSLASSGGVSVPNPFRVLAAAVAKHRGGKADRETETETEREREMEMQIQGRDWDRAAGRAPIPADRAAEATAAARRRARRLELIHNLKSKGVPVPQSVEEGVEMEMERRPGAGAGAGGAAGPGAEGGAWGTRTTRPSVSDDMSSTFDSLDSALSAEDGADGSGGPGVRGQRATGRGPGDLGAGVRLASLSGPGSSAPSLVAGLLGRTAGSVGVGGAGAGGGGGGGILPVVAEGSSRADRARSVA
jgi:hypothetical protein